MLRRSGNNRVGFGLLGRLTRRVEPIVTGQPLAAARWLSVALPDITRIGSPSTCVSWAEQPYLCPASADTGYSFEEEIKSRLLDSAFSLRYLLSRFRRIGL